MEVNIFQIIGWILSSLTIFAMVFVALGKRINFYIYIFSNVCWITFWIVRKEYFTIPMFIIGIGLCIFGLFKWKKKGIK